MFGSNKIYGFYGGGYTGTDRNEIEYIDLTLLTGNATDRGDLTLARYGFAGLSGSIYGFYGGGHNSTLGATNNIDYIDLTLLTGNATDRGDLSVERRYLAGLSGSVYGFYGGGHDGSVYTNVYSSIIDYIDLTSLTGNATDRGDLVVARENLTGV